MSRKRFTEANCSAAQALEQIGDWWSLLVVREAFYGVTTFSAFEERLGIAKNILADRLARLVEHGVFARERMKPDVDRYAYRLTDKGRDLLPVLIALMQWGDRWVAGQGKEPVRIVSRVDSRPIAPIAVTAAGGAPLSFAELAFAPGPGANEATLELFRRNRPSQT